MLLFAIPGVVRNRLRYASNPKMIDNNLYTDNIANDPIPNIVNMTTEYPMFSNVLYCFFMIVVLGYWFLIIERMPVDENGFVLPSIQITSYMIGCLQNVFNIVPVMMFVISKMFPLFVSNVPIEN